MRDRLLVGLNSGFVQVFDLQGTYVRSAENCQITKAAKIKISFFPVQTTFAWTGRLCSWLSVVSNLMFPFFKTYVGVGTDCREKELHNKGVKVIKHQAGLNERIFTGIITKL